MELYSISMDEIVSGPSLLVERLKDIDNMTDNELYDILKTSYHIFLSNAINSPIFKNLRQNPRFIIVLSQIVVEVDLTLEQRIYCNSMLYKELSNLNPENTTLQRVYYILGMNANYNMTKKIMDAGIKQALAIYIAIVRKSSFNNSDNISRLNFTIVCDKPDVMTVQTITNVYCAIFNTVEDIKNLFLLTIRDTYVFTANESWITEDTLKIASNMNFAVLSLLESLPVVKIKDILKEYGTMAMIDDLELEDVRFSFKRLDLTKFPKILEVMNYLRNEHNLILL